VQQNPARYLAILDNLVGECAKADQKVTAAQFSEVQGLASGKDSRYWNNAGLFWRDAGDDLRRGKTEKDHKLAMEYYETALKAY
jgi:hypothetical protein